MNIYDVIHKDHQDAKKSIAEIRSFPSNRHIERVKLFRLLKTALISHNDSEQESFYDALLQHEQTREDTKLSIKEHDGAHELLDALENEGLTPEEWSQKFEELCVALEQHIAKEEGKIFEEARQVLPEETAIKLAQKMESLKHDRTLLLKEAS